MTKHHPLGASNAERWTNCPGSVALIQQAPPSTGNQYAAEGTIAHELVSKCLDGSMTLRHVELLANEKTVMHHDGFAVPITFEMMDAMNLYVEYVNNIPGGIFQWIERRVSIPDVVDGDPLFGTADAIVYALDNVLHVVDFKYGAGVVVDVQDNKQLLFYALGAMLSMDLPVDHVETHIVQPRTSAGTPTKSWRYSKDEVLSFWEHLKASALEIKNNPDKLVAGDWCRWCPADKICPALKTFAESTLMTDFIDVEIIEERQLPSITNWSPEMLGSVLNNIDVVEKLISSIKNYAYNLAQTGTAIPGYKLVQKRSNRAYVDENKARGDFIDLVGPEALNNELKSPAQLEKVIKKMPKCEARRLALELFEQHVHKPDNGTTLVKDTDTREKADARALKDFENYVE